jgi:hypothetical protein
VAEFVKRSVFEQVGTFVGRETFDNFEYEIKQGLGKAILLQFNSVCIGCSDHNDPYLHENCHIDYISGGSCGGDDHHDNNRLQKRGQKGAKIKLGSSF